MGSDAIHLPFTYLFIALLIINFISHHHCYFVNSDCSIFILISRNLLINRLLKIITKSILINIASHLKLHSKFYNYSK